jgi:hypothetical protein
MDILNWYEDEEVNDQRVNRCHKFLKEHQYRCLRICNMTTDQSKIDLQKSMNDKYYVNNLQ